MTPSTLRCSPEWVKSFRIPPCSTHKARFTAGKDLHDSVQVTGLGFRGFQHGEVAKNLLFAARNQGIPSTLSRRIFSQGQAEQLRQRVGRSAPIGVIERQIDRHPVSDFAARRLSHRLMKVQIERAVTSWHEIDVPWISGALVYADRYGKRPTPVSLQLSCNLCTHANIGINASNFDRRAESYQ